MTSHPLVVLDLDGTLLDSSARHFALYNEIAGRVDISALPQDDYWKLRRSGISNIAVLKQQGLSTQNINVAMEMWNTRIESEEFLQHDFLFDGVFQWLTNLKSHAQLLVVTLRSNSASLRRQMQWLNLDGLLDEVVAVPHQRDAAAAKCKAVQQAIGEQRPRVWIGDTEVDMCAAKILGVPAIGVTSGMRDEQTLLSAGAAQVFQYVCDISLVQCITI